MKLFRILFSLVTLIALMGCHKDKTPSIDDVIKLSTTAGVTTGTVLNLMSLDIDTKVTIVDITAKVSEVVPEIGIKFEDAWNPIAIEHVQKLIDEGKLDSNKGKLVLEAFDLLTKGIDYLIFTQYPKVSQKLELIEAAVHGFINGFNSVFAPFVGVNNDHELNKELYDYLIKFIEK